MTSTKKDQFCDPPLLPRSPIRKTELYIYYLKIKNPQTRDKFQDHPLQPYMCGRHKCMVPYKYKDANIRKNLIQSACLVIINYLIGLFV